MATTLFEDLGGEPALRKIIDRFVDRIFDDVMIGFFFRNARRERVKAKEYEFAARHLGADIPYTGRAIDEAHRSHPIMGGQFARRLTILKQTLEELGVPEHVRTHWLAHTESLRSLVTSDGGRECDPEQARARAEASRKEP
ncbi:MAG: group 1 truncated hemoglobin [Myxococcales bacterium]|nr:MAG: group 1 truncated hemoglobin [Myxococcales bacterium]